MSIDTFKQHSVIKFIDMKEDQLIRHLQRYEGAGRLMEFMRKIGASKVFCSEESKLKFVESLTVDEFKSLLVRINGIIRGKSISHRGADGDDVYIMSLDGVEYVPPRHYDKIELLDETLEAAKKLEDVRDVAALFAIMITHLHPFSDGNGRTSRLAYMLFSRNYVGEIDRGDQIMSLLDMNGRNVVDTNPEDVQEYLLSQTLEEDKVSFNNPNFPIRTSETWLESKRLNAELTEDDCKELDKISITDEVEYIYALYKFLKEKGTLEKYLEPIMFNGAQTNTMIDMKKLVPDLTRDDIEGIMETYWETKKEMSRKIIDAFVNPKKYLLDGITLKDFYIGEVEASLN